MIRKVFKTNILIVYYPSVAPKKYFAKNLDLCEPKNLLFSTALTVTKLLKKIHQTAVSSKLMKATKKSSSLNGRAIGSSLRVYYNMVLILQGC